MRASILWRRLDRPGYEACELTRWDAGFRLSGSAVFEHGGGSCRLDYAIVADPLWNTTSARVEGWVGSKPIDVEVAVDSARRWMMNGIVQPSVEGGLDVDLNFSPSTNLLPIRRLALEVGQSAAGRAAWLRFPEFRLEPLDQVSRRIAPLAYRYESASGRFTVEIDVEENGFVARYPGFWEREAAHASFS